MKLKCPACRGSFKWDTSTGWPRFCSLCGYDTSMDDNPEVAMPHVSAGHAKAMLKSSDQVFNAYSKATEENAKTAAELAGVPVSEMADLKITNMNTQLREGDLAVTPPSNPVSQMIDSKPGMFGFQDRGQAQGFAAAAHTGKDAHAGAKAGATVNDFHRRNAAAMIRAGEMGRH